MMSTIGNNSNFDDNMILSLPAVLANNSRLVEHNINESLNPITTQNYADKYKDLENVLADEKKTNEELQKYYKVLKVDHTRIKNETFELKSQMQNLVEENKVMQEKYKSMFEKMQQELRRKQLFIEELKTKELDEVKLDRLKEDLSQQIEAPYKDIVRQLEQELQKLQSEFNRMRQEANNLRSASEHEKAEHHNYLEQIKLKQEIELNAIRKDRDILRQKLQENNQAEAIKIKEVIRENNQFRIKIKSLVDENEELREKLSHTESHNNSLVRSHSKLISDLSTKLSVLESEKESLKQQADNSYKECVNLQETLANNVRKLHDTERENTSLKLKFDEVQHNCKRDLANLKLEMVKERGERNREKEALNNNIQDLMLKVEIANNNVELQKKLLDEKDRELTSTINGVNEKNWTKINELTNEKIDLESKIQLLSKDFEFKLSTLQVEKDKSDDRLKSFENQREEILKENTRLRSLIIDSENLQNELEREQEKNRELVRKCHKLETELSSNTGLEQELTEINLKLKNEILFYGQEVQCLKEKIKRQREEYENRFMEIKSDHNSERNDFNFKNQDLQSKLNRAMEKISQFKQTNEKKKKKFQTYAKAIKMKSDMLNAKMKELMLKEQSINQMVPMQAYNKLKAHLDSITSRHQAFREVIIQGENYSSSNVINKADQTLRFQPNFDKRFDSLMPVVQKVSQSYFSSPKNNKVFEPDTKILIESFKFDASEKNELESKIEDITNRIDNLQSEQNDKLKSNSNSKNTIENITNRSIEKSRSQSPDRKSQFIRTPSPDKSKISITSNQENVHHFDDFKQKDVEIKRLSFSSSSSSSISNFSKEDDDKKNKKESKITEDNIDEHKSNFQEEKDSISYEEDFENSAKSSSSDNDDF